MPIKFQRLYIIVYSNGNSYSILNEVFDIVNGKFPEGISKVRYDYPTLVTKTVPEIQRIESRGYYTI